MDQVSGPSSVGMQGPQPKRCPLCGVTVIPDPLGLYECACGWGGPGDPLEHDRGLARLFARTDRDLANGQAHRDLSRLAARGDSASSLNPFYVMLLLLIATVVYVVVAGIVGGCVWLVVVGIRDHAWLMVFVGALFLALIVNALWPHRRSHQGVRVTRERFPSLMTALDEVGQRVGTPVPTRVVLVPDDDFDIGRRLFGGDVLHIGAANLALLSDVGMKSMLAHELAHADHGDTLFHRFTGQAEYLLHEIVYGILEGVIGQAQGVRRSSQIYRRGGTRGTGATFLAVILTWTLLLPFRLLWSLFHLLRMHASRSAEFAADRAAIRAYGPQAFIDGLSGVLVAQRTFYRNSGSLTSAMRSRSSGNFYAEMRRHFDELPPNITAQLRVDAASDFRTLANSHPITPDRLRAAYQTFGTLPASPAPSMPAYKLLIPSESSDANVTETELTALLFAPKKK